MTDVTLVRPAAGTPAQPAGPPPPPSTGLVVADPDLLRAAASVGRATEAGLLQAAAVLRAVGAALAASGSQPVGCVGALPALEPLAEALLATATTGRRLDGHLERVATALERADAGRLSPRPHAGLPGLVEDAVWTGAQTWGEEAAGRAARAGRTGVVGALGHSVLDIALALGRPLPRGLVAVAAHTPLLSLVLAPPLAGVVTLREGTPYPEALAAELAGAVAGAAVMAGAAFLAPVVVPAAAAVAVGAAAGWLATELTGRWLARRRRERAQRA